jgi:hypothetical protein
MEGLQVAPCFSRFEFNSSYIYFNILEGHYLENIFLNNFFFKPLVGATATSGLHVALPL